MTREPTETTDVLLDADMEALHAEITRRYPSDVFRLAKQVFEDLAGAFDEDDGDAMRTAMFLDWFAIDRRPPEGPTPLEAVLADPPAGFASDRLARLAQLRTSFRGIFSVERVDGSAVLLRDALRGTAWSARWILPFAGVRPGQLLSTRLCLSGAVLTAGRGTVLHPQQARPFILRIVERAKKEGLSNDDLVYTLDKAKYKLDTYAHVHPHHVYRYPTDQVF